MNRKPVVVLPDSLINVIAAGEVIERPASVEKELLENSLDAGADRIVVQLQDGGRRMISVEDNGSGMSEQDALMAIERHATSKIAEQGDLNQIRTLGFRGEALPSIAAVGRFVMETWDGSAPSGTRLVMDSGKLVKVEACGRPRGTSVNLRGIFSKIPARRKFLKSRETEISWCLRAVEDLAFAYPEVHFEVHSERGVVLSFPPVAGIRERIAAVWGAESAHRLAGLHWNDGDVEITGFLSSPSETYPRRSRHQVLVNGRPVRDPSLNRAISSALANRYPPGRFPALVLSVGLPPDKVDVNVHPSKREVRIRDLQRISAALREIIGSLSFTGQHPGKAVDPSARVSGPDRGPAPVRSPSSGDLRAGDGTTAYGGAVDVGLPLKIDRRVLGQHLGTYIIVQDGEELWLIDQHAAHERVVYNRLMELRERGGGHSQKLLIPELVELSGSEVNNLLSKRKILESFGFEIEEFGGNEVRLLAVPAAVSGQNAGALLKSVAADLAEIPDLPDEIGLLISRWACKMSVTAGRSLSVAEMERLVSDLNKAQAGYACPHGRPTHAIITPEELEKLFDRR